MKQGGEEIYQALRELRSANSEKVLDPQTPILKAASGMQIAQYLTVGNPSSKRFSGAKGWDEWTVQVGFREKRGYTFQDLIAFCRTIEAKNSKAQVRSINFGKRDRNSEVPHWRPTAMTVRVFKPTDR